MGRSPNQVVFEFFDRGSKFVDASNRYHKTCSSCVGLASAAFDWKSKSKVSGQKPGSTKQSMSALYALAEVSRNRLGIRDRNNSSISHDRLPEILCGDDVAQEDGVTVDNYLVQDEVFTVQKKTIETDESVHFTRSGVRMLPLPSDTSGNSNCISATYQRPVIAVARDGATNSISTSTSPPILRASITNSLQDLVPSGSVLEPDVGSPRASISDKYFRSQSRIDGLWSVQATDPLLRSSNRSLSSSGYYLRAESSATLRPLATSSTTGDGEPLKGDNNKSRASKGRMRCKFSDSRRKEVQAIRRKGACIRCRMLKKPCSNDNPCNTCVSVESARLWKQPCVRTRIADELTLFSAGLQEAVASHAIEHIRSQFQRESFSADIRATHFPKDNIYINFLAQKFSYSKVAFVTSRLRKTEVQGTLTSMRAVVVDPEDKDITSKIEKYISTISGKNFGRDLSDFMDSTLKTARSLTPNAKTVIIDHVLDLWAATQILTEPSLKWRLYFTLSSTTNSYPLSPFLTPDIYNLNLARTEISPSEQQSDCYNIVTLQLLAATEKHAAKLSKAIMNELERRLLQRRQASPFETFLVTVILLACLGRMAWSFRAWELQSNSDMQNSEIQPGKERWPLNKPPSYFIQQSDRLSDTLRMLLKIRGVPGGKERHGNTSAKLKDRNKDNIEKMSNTWSGKTSKTGMKDTNAERKSTRDKTQAFGDDDRAKKSQSASTNISPSPSVSSSSTTPCSVYEYSSNCGGYLKETNEDYRQIQDRWYAAVRGIIADDPIMVDHDDDDGVDDNSDVDVEMLDVVTTSAKNKNKNKNAKKVEEKAVPPMNEMFDQNDPRCWELRYVSALLRSSL